MIPNNQSPTVRVSTDATSGAIGKDETGRFLNAIQSSEEIASREACAPAEGSAVGGVAFAALLPQDTQARLTRFLRRFEDGATPPRNAYEAMPLVELWNDSLSREIPRENPIRARCLQIIDSLNQQFNNISTRLLSAASYLHVDANTGAGENFFNSTEFVTEMMDSFIKQADAASIEDALEADPCIFMNDASVKQFIYVIAKYNFEIPQFIKAKASKFIEGMLKTPRYMLMNNMIDEARLITGAEYEPAFTELAPSVENLCRVYQYQPSGDMVG